ncbi:MAG: hypothetical protein HZA25_00965 [Candidatus Niyogibacteria bacterium]|nr:hypothetical protein [Candidatus Niyogibacteria bacterium]
MQNFKDKYFSLSVLVGAAMLVASLVVNFYALNYVNESISNPVTDVVLDNTRVHDVDGIFVYGTIAFFFVLVAAGLAFARSIPFLLKSIALFYLIRSFFISLTHISPYPTHMFINAYVAHLPYLQRIFNGDDLFFSGHTGMPFLIALIFWENTFFRTAFIAFSAIFAAVVLLGHIHYSIDVASAYFITFTIFVIAKTIFARDWAIFNNPIAK